MKISELFESASEGAMVSANFATVVNPQISPGPARGKRSYTGRPGKSGTKSPSQPKVKSVTAHDTNVSLFGEGNLIKR